MGIALVQDIGESTMIEHAIMSIVRSSTGVGLDRIISMLSKCLYKALDKRMKENNNVNK